MNRGNDPHRGVPGGNDPLGGMDDADVADMWVLNPDTGSFELRAPSAETSADEPHGSVPRSRTG
ncbi:hypothetical protein, partial [Streptomyces sp. SID3343]|uniref:hypothetical protein n=1 Tax=Streptomyces sp. SID3343 TaxID=2690260 RepID=UPI0013686E65